MNAVQSLRGYSQHFLQFGQTARRRPKIYLAGPDVFLRDPIGMANAKKKICEEYGFKGVFPLDNELNLKGKTPEQAGMAIFKANVALMNSSDLIVANMTPFRGPSMDVGTAFEMGYMFAKGKPVYGYSNKVDLFSKRTADHYQGRVQTRNDGTHEDPDGNAIENFSLVDNLMMPGAVCDSTCQPVVTADAPQDRIYTYLAAFREAVAQAAKSMNGNP